MCPRVESRDVADGSCLGPLSAGPRWCPRARQRFHGIDCESHRGRSPVIMLSFACWREIFVCVFSILSCALASTPKRPAFSFIGAAGGGTVLSSMSPCSQGTIRHDERDRGLALSAGRRPSSASLAASWHFLFDVAQAECLHVCDAALRFSRDERGAIVGRVTWRAVLFHGRVSLCSALIPVRRTV